MIKKIVQKLKIRPNLAKFLRGIPIIQDLLGLPKGVRANGEWLIPEARSKIPGVRKFHQLADREVRHIPPANPIKESDLILWEWATSLKPLPRYTVVLEKWHLLRPGVLVSPDGLIDWNLSPLWGCKPLEHYHLTYPVIALPRRLKGRSLNLCTTSSNNYFHWTLDLLPKLLVARDSGYTWDSFDHIIVNSQSYEFQRETLRRFGIKNSQIRILENLKHVVPDEMTVPFMADQSGIFSQEYISELRGILMGPARIKSVSRNRIYITRSKSKGRMISNKGEVEDLLKKRGFITVDLEGMTLAQQIEIFESAEIIVAVHGASLTNLLYCQPGTRILELVHSGYAHQMYYYLSKISDLRHYYLICDPQINPGNKNMDPQFLDLHVDLLGVQKFLETV